MSFRLPGSPYGDDIALAVLQVLFLPMIFDLRNPTWYYSLIAAAVLLIGHNLTYEIARRNIAKKGLPPVELRPHP